jgi:hypothetical protein
MPARASDLPESPRTRPVRGQAWERLARQLPLSAPEIYSSSRNPFAVRTRDPRFRLKTLRQFSLLAFYRAPKPFTGFRSAPQTQVTDSAQGTSPPGFTQRAGLIRAQGRRIRRQIRRQGLGDVGFLAPGWCAGAKHLNHKAGTLGSSPDGSGAIDRR